jgi:GT2 family glycosyltransferase
MKLSIIIINYNTFRMTCDCLRDIYANTWEFSFEIILVDNASVECDPEKFKELFPLITLIKSPANGGFSRGNNLGIAVAKGEYLLILNSDTLNLNDGVKQCVDYLDIRRHERDLGGVSCKILSPDGSMQRSAFDYRTRAHSALLNNSVFSYIASKLGMSKYRDEYYVTAMHQQEHPVQAMLGAFMLIRREAVEKAGPFEPDFFMYCEEIEWCYRINDHGFRLMYIPEAHIIHIGGGSSSLVTKKEINNKQFYLSILMLTFKQDGYLGLVLFNLIFCLNFVTNMLLLPFRSAEIREGHKSLLRGTWYSLRRQGILLKYFKPTFASSKFPFKTAIVEELAGVSN